MSFFDQHPEFESEGKIAVKKGYEHLKRKSTKSKPDKRRFKEDVDISKMKRALSYLTQRDKSDDDLCLFCNKHLPDVLMGVCAKCATPV